LRDRRQGELGDGATLPADEHVFLFPDGSAYKSLSQLFRKVSDRCPYAAEGYRYTPYSLRHAFATEHVAAGAPLPVLSKAMGTQTRMLEQHYLHNQGLDLRPYLDKQESPCNAA
jgi:integrase